MEEEDNEQRYTIYVTPFQHFQIYYNVSQNLEPYDKDIKEITEIIQRYFRDIQPHCRDVLYIALYYKDI